MRRLALSASALLLAGVVSAQEGAPKPVVTTAAQIADFRIGGGEQVFGPFTFVGGLSLVSPDRNFGALSSIRFLEDGERFIAIADTGFFVRGRVLRDAAGRPENFVDLTFEEMRDAEGGFSKRKWEVDAESLDLDGDRITIGFERVHRLVQYRLSDGGRLVPDGGEVPFLVPRAELRSNRGFETLVHGLPDGLLAGARIAISEKSLDKAGNIFAAVLEGPMTGVFTIARSGEFDITDGDVLPDGDILILERSYRIRDGIRMQIRRLKADDIRPGAVVDGEIVLSADLSSQIDNMEGLDVFRAPDGSLRMALVSDDNKSILQRNLYLEFVIAE